MNKGLVHCCGVFAGTIKYQDGGYVFSYDDDYLNNSSLPPIAFSFPKRKLEYRSDVLFPFFYGLLAEGADKAVQCATLRIDEDDHFTRLLKTAGETIGAITIKEAT